MVNEQGNLILQKCYKIWLKVIDYKKRPDVAVFEGCLRDVMEDKNMELDILTRIVIKKKNLKRELARNLQDCISPQAMNRT